MFCMKALALLFILCTTGISAEIDSNGLLDVNWDHTHSDLTALYKCIVEELDTREDRSVIYQLLCEIKDSSVPVRGGINIYLPSGESFYFEDWNKFGHLLSNIVTIEPQSIKRKKEDFYCINR